MWELLVTRIIVGIIDAYFRHSEIARREGRAMTKEELDAVAQDSVNTRAAEAEAEARARADAKTP